MLLEERLGKALFEGDRDTASRIVAEGESSLHHLFSAAIAHWQIDAETLKLLLEQEIRRELFRWEKGLALLGTAARLAPLLGLLGTVLGMVEIFRLLPESAASPKAGVSAAATAAGWPVSIAGDGHRIPHTFHRNLRAPPEESVPYEPHTAEALPRSTKARHALRRHHLPRAGNAARRKNGGPSSFRGKGEGTSDSVAGRTVTLDSGDELFIPSGVAHGGCCTAGTRTIHAFGGRRTEREA